jgi:TrmH family RNA methyltransferase
VGVDRSRRNRPAPAGPPITPETLAPRALSARNPRVAHLGRLVRQRRARDEDGLFVIDGPVLLADAVRDGVLVDDVYLRPGALDDPAVAQAVAAAASDGARVWEVAGGLDGHVDPTTPHGVAAVAQRPGTTSPSGSRALHVVLVGVADPGNVGTLLRTAEAVGAHSIVIADGSADAWSPKVVRASAGSVWRIELDRGSAASALARLGAQGVQRVGAAGGVGVAPDRLDLSGPVALVLGSEAHGLPDEVAVAIDSWASLPMEGAVESLNVAVAGSVLAFEVVRQRAGATAVRP